MLDTTSPSSTQAIPNVLPRTKWAKRIVAAWQSQVLSIFEVGSLLVSANNELKRGEWIAMIKSDLPFSRSTANKLIKIATCDHLRNAEHVPHLPAHWGTLFELALLTAEQFKRGICAPPILSEAGNSKSGREAIEPQMVSMPSRAGGSGEMDTVTMRLRVLELKTLRCFFGEGRQFGGLRFLPTTNFSRAGRLTPCVRDQTSSPR